MLREVLTGLKILYKIDPTAPLSVIDVNGDSALCVELPVAGIRLDKRIQLEDNSWTNEYDLWYYVLE